LRLVILLTVEMPQDLHIPDGYLDPSVCIVLYVAALVALGWALKRVGISFRRSYISVIAVSSSFVFVSQMINFPIAAGTSGHLVGGTFLAMLLGPEGAVIGMTIVLMIEAFFFGDGGLTTLGANIFNMAVIGALSYHIVSYLMNRAKTGPAASVFAVSWLSVMLGALAAGIEIGVSSLFAPSGGPLVTVPAMLSWHAFIGLGEGAITTILVTQLVRSYPISLSGLNGIRGLMNERNN
jgi:cobalt/nickel transport system permease protein